MDHARRRHQHPELEAVVHDRARAAAVERAVRAAANAILERDFTRAEIAAALARVSEALVGDEQTPRERVAATRQADRDKMVAAMRRLGQAGRGRSAADAVARDFARDRRDPVEIESLKRKLRRWRKQNSGQCPDG
jgi:hypothetical protein